MSDCLGPKPASGTSRLAGWPSSISLAGGIFFCIGPGSKPITSANYLSSSRFHVWEKREGEDWFFQEASWADPGNDPAYEKSLKIPRLGLAFIWILSLPRVFFAFFLNRLVFYRRPGCILWELIIMTEWLFEKKRAFPALLARQQTSWLLLSSES